MDAFERVTEVRPRGLNSALTWADMFPESDDAEAEFIATWDKVRVPVGEDFLRFAYARALKTPLRVRNPVSEKYTLYLSIAFHLQVLRPEDYIMLPVERLGKLMEVRTRTVSFYSDLAKKDGYLRLIAKHYQPSARAARYTFACERFQAETGEELTAEEESHFHKDNKDSEDFKDSEESHDQEETCRTKEELERPEGLSGSGIDFERQKGKSGARFPRKISSLDRRKELQEQARFLIAREQQKTS